MRVSCKYDSTSSERVFANVVQHFTKTTLVHSAEETSWELLEDRVAAKEVIDTKNIVNIVVYLQEPREGSCIFESVAGFRP